MSTIKRGDFAIAQGVNVKVYDETIDTSKPPLRTVQSGDKIGTVTGATITLRQNTYIQILTPIASFSSPVGFNFAKVYVDAEFVTGQTNPGYDVKRDIAIDGPPVGRDNPNIYEQNVGGKPVSDTQQNGSVPVDVGNGKTVYVKTDGSAATGNTPGTTTPNPSNTATTKWVKYGIIGALVVAIGALIYVLTKSK